MQHGAHAPEQEVPRRVHELRDLAGPVHSELLHANVRQSQDHACNRTRAMIVCSHMHDARADTRKAADGARRKPCDQHIANLDQPDLVLGAEALRALGYVDEV